MTPLGSNLSSSPSLHPRLPLRPICKALYISRTSLILHLPLFLLLVIRRPSNIRAPHGTILSLLFLGLPRTGVIPLVFVFRKFVELLVNLLIPQLNPSSQQLKDKCKKDLKSSQVIQNLLLGILLAYVPMHFTPLLRRKYINYPY